MTGTVFTRSRLVAWSAGIIIVTASAPVGAQPSPLPQAYTIVENNALLRPGASQTIYRDGSKALVDQILPPAPGSSTPTHVRTFYDLSAHRSLSWDASTASATCGSGTFSGDWGDPFEMSAQMAKDLAAQHARTAGTDTVAGIITTRMAATAPQGGTAIVWLDPKTGLVMKLQMAPPNGTGQTLVEVTNVTLTAPAASVFAPPAACGSR